MKQILESMSNTYNPDERFRQYNYQGIEAAPSIRPRRKYCDLTGLPAEYVDPGTRMRYHSAPVWQFIRGLSPEVVQSFLKSYFLTHLTNAWQVDQAILTEEDRLVLFRFGHDWDPECMKMDEILYSVADRVAQWCAIYVVDITQVPDFNAMYELYDPCTVMFFWRNRHMQVDLGTGNNNKINWAMDDKQELLDILEVVWKGAKKGKGLVVSPRDYSSRHK